MKKLITLAAASAMAVASFGAQAQTVDGVLNANEMTAGKYVLLGKFTNPRGFGSYGLLSLYAANTADKVYIFVAGTVEHNGNGFQLFLDLPAAGGVPKGTALPAAPVTTPPSYFKLTTKMELPVDLGLALRGSGADSKGADAKIEGASYTSATTVIAKMLTTEAAPLPAAGTALTLADNADFPMLKGARMAYKNTPGGILFSEDAVTKDKTPVNPGYYVDNTNANYGGQGSYGWEIELDRSAIGALTGTPKIGLFVMQNGGDGGYISTDFIPQTSAPAGNIANSDVDFATIAGIQAAYISLTATGASLGSKAAIEAATALRFGMYPNPGSAVSVNYTVPQGKQQVALSVYDATGKQVRSFGAAQTGSQSYKLSGLNAGIYVVKLNVGGQQTSGKVVIE